MNKQTFKPYINIMDPKQIRQRRILSLTGFTLIELVIVIVILGILATIAIPRYTGIVEKRRGEVCINNMRMIFSAWRIYNMSRDPDYDPNGGFRTIDQINTQFESSIRETYFGVKDGNAGFYMNAYADRLYLSTYRRSGPYSGRRIWCNYYFNTGTYDWAPDVYNLSWFNIFPEPEE